MIKTKKATTVETTVQQSPVAPPPVSTQPMNLVVVQRFNGRTWDDYFYASSKEIATSIVASLKLLGAPAIQYRIL